MRILDDRRQADASYFFCRLPFREEASSPEDDLVQTTKSHVYQLRMEVKSTNSFCDDDDEAQFASHHFFNKKLGLYVLLKIIPKYTKF